MGIRPEVVDWQHYALCAQVGSDHWFPHKNEKINSAVLDSCQRCPVRRDCLISALLHHDYHGVWAGLVPSEMQNLRDLILAGVPIEEAIEQGLAAGVRDEGEPVYYRRMRSIPHGPTDENVRTLTAILTGREVAVDTKLPGKDCAWCGMEFHPPRGSAAIYCSLSCRQARYRQRKREVA